MKVITYLSILGMLTLSTVNAQCLREGSLIAIDDPAQYPVTGNSMMQFETNGDKQVIFGPDFATVQGIELRVYVSTTQRLGEGGNELEITTEPLQDDNGGQDTGDPITGMKTFDLPSDVSLSDFTYVIIQCVQADVLWGRAELGTTSGPDCNILSLNTNNLDAFVVYPNPASQEISIAGIDDSSVGIRIFDLSGRVVYEEIQNTTKNVDISNLTSGNYILSISTDTQISTKQLQVK
jgi:hypothetical protein